LKFLRIKELNKLKKEMKIMKFVKKKKLLKELKYLKSDSDNQILFANEKFNQVKIDSVFDLLKLDQILKSKYQIRVPMLGNVIQLYTRICWS
jgi:hypothetical protein